MSEISNSDTPLRTKFKIRLNGKTVSIGTVGQAYRFITNRSSVEWMESSFSEQQADIIAPRIGLFFCTIRGTNVALWSCGGQAVPRAGLALMLVGLLGFVLGGCTQSTLAPSSDANLTPRDRQLLAHPPYAQATIPEPYRRHIVDYPRKEASGTILVDTDARYLYYVLPGGKAIRYGVAVGEEALAWSGVATVGRIAEWPDWIPTPEIQARLGPYPARIPGGPANPLGARALYLYEGNKDTLYRIHGTNQPEYIGQAISSGCIRMTNEDVIDLFDRVKLGATVVVLAPGQSGWIGSVAGPGARSGAAL